MPNRVMRSAPSREFRRLFGVLALFCLLGLRAATAQAGDDVKRLASQLKGHEDFRVRTQAALALGASGSQDAVAPLCAGLDDASTTVRAAAAAGLGKLNQGGSECLEARLKKETAKSVKVVIRQSLEKINVGGAAEITDSTRYYVAIAAPTDGAGQPLTEYDSLVRKAMIESVRSTGEFAFASAQESPEESKKRLKGKANIKGFYLTPKITPPSYEGGNLTIKFELALFTYPTKVLKGMLPVKLTEQGVTQESRSREEALLQMVAGRAMEKFASQIERIR